ncbi:uncharacterized protein LOC124257765 isoform X2 [Haliotis rubra]|uniref:uncharacterized protein LOC124257765 isoform X2 n=1 Tax=Haliotis rubra TaxID=36100 RepID=UPI001EE621CB|nr:uncharacterized protein LOC124257765 isoform X2 [Haliotis rubra]
MCNKARILLFLSLLLCVDVSMSGVSKGKQDFAVNVSSDGTYSIVVQGDVWLKSAPTFFRADGQVFSSADGSLKLVKNTQSSGVDVIGQWEANSFLYQAGSSQIEASFVQYTPDPSIFTYNNPAIPFMLFKQRYINGANNTAFNSNFTISGFPGFLIQESTIPLGYLSYGGLMFGFKYLTAGQWGPSSFKIDDGIEGGPLTLFDKVKTANTLIISPASRFMSSSIWRQNSSTGGDNVYWGTMGGVVDVPVGVESSFILFCGNQGINKAMVSWGQILKQWHGRTDQYVKSDFTINYLGYWTDNGAYYSYLPEKGKNHQDTVLDINSYMVQIGVPVKYIQFDVWWYITGNDHGVVTWSAKPTVFPNGMEWLFNKTELPVFGYNTFWSSNTTYATANGGKYEFLIDVPKSLPLEERFWTDLLAEGRKWGLFAYEQDYLSDEFRGINKLLTDIDLGRQWLTQMGNGAAKNGLTIQYCMAYPRFMLQSLEIPVVTQARASHDNRPGTDNWKIGVTSLFAWAIGVAPFKDNFWTTSVQPGNTYNSTEPHTSLHAVVATLSTGPVGISDMIGGTNKTLIMKSVNADGLILKPSRPATAIDNRIRRMAWSDFDGPNGEVWSTYSDFGGDNKYGIILAADLKGSYNMTPCMAGYQGFPSSMVFPANNPNKIQPLTDSQPLTMSGCTKADFCLFYVSPVLTINGKQVLIQGELDKWVPMSPQRVTDINIAEDITISLTGAVHETVSFWFNVDGKSSPVTCTLGAGGLATLRFTAGTCRGV